ncbi:hypothetical protein, partial [Leuconostoc citreum]|uniref:hypothetical protein n=1 Tax=Leuconostoc citreum TaxID=33964 RepID=UPI001C1FE82D
PSRKKHNYPLPVISTIPLKVFGFTLFEITDIYNTKVMLYNVTTLIKYKRCMQLSRIGVLGGFSLCKKLFLVIKNNL